MLNTKKYNEMFGLGDSPGIKPVFYFFILILFSFKSTAQENLVPNGSFEEYYSCPTANDLNDGQFERCKYWWKPTMGTSDYFNRCNNGVVGVPNNLYGNQEPFHGDGYVGIGMVSWNLNGDYVGSEYVKTELISSLKPCTEYYFNMYVSLADFSTHGVGKLGAWFSSDNEFTNTWFSLDEIPQVIYKSSPIVDTINWVKVEGIFMASGFEKYLTIGYFQENVYMDTIFIQDWGVGSYSYYYIDSVSLYEIEEVSSQLCNYQIDFPNVFTPNNDGVNDFIDLSLYMDFIDKIRIINRWGNTVDILTKDNPIWDGSNCVDGVYYYIVEDEKIKIKQTGFIHLVR